MSKLQGALRIMLSHKFLMTGVFLAIACVVNLLAPRIAAAQSLGWCVREIERNDEYIVIDHNPSCDLRGVVRMYPQKDPDSGDALLMQVQLRSIYASNQTRMVEGKRARFTVMRGCVAPGKVPPGADEEEKEMCPNGIVNYFSAPYGSQFARIQVPISRKLTRAEKGLRIAEATCPLLAEKTAPSQQDQRMIARCKEIFPSMAFKTPEPVESEDHKQLVVAQSTIGSLRQSVKNQEAHLASLAPLLNRGKWYWPLMLGLFGLLVYGGGSTMYMVRNRRRMERKHRDDLQDWQDRYQTLLKEKEVLEKNPAAAKAALEAELREKLSAEIEEKYRKILEKKTAGAERHIEQLQEAKKRLEQARDQAYQDGREDGKREAAEKAGQTQEVDALRLEVRTLTKVAEDRRANIAERDAELEERERQIAHQVAQIKELQSRVEEAEEATSVSSDDLTALAEKEQEVRDLIRRNEELDRRNEELVSANEDLERQNNELFAEQEPLMLQVRQHTELHDEWRRRKAELETHIRELEGSRKRLAAQLAERNFSMGNLENALNDRDMEIRELQARVARLEASVNSMGQKPIQSDKPQTIDTPEEHAPKRTLPFTYAQTLNQGCAPSAVNEDPDQTGSRYRMIADRAESAAVEEASGEAAPSDPPEDEYDVLDRPTWVGDPEDLDRRARESVRPEAASGTEEVMIPRSPRPPAFAAQEADDWKRMWREIADGLVGIDPRWQYASDASPQTVARFLLAKVKDLHGAFSEMDGHVLQLRTRNQALIAELDETKQRMQQLRNNGEKAQALADGLQKIIDEKGPSDRKCAHYELERLQAEQQRLQAERALQEYKRRYGPLEESAVASIREMAMVKDTKLEGWSDIALMRLQLHLAYEVVRRCNNGESLDLALSSDKDLQALYEMLVRIRIMSGYEYALPRPLLESVGPGTAPMLAHIAGLHVKIPEASLSTRPGATIRPESTLVRYAQIDPIGEPEEVSGICPSPRVEEKKSG